MTATDPCGGDVKGGGGCTCDPPFATPRAAKRIVGDDAARFWSKVEKTDGCWLWRGTVFTGGRPAFPLLKPRRTAQAHRWLYEQTVGPIPAKHRLIPGCGESSCVRVHPDHRVLVSIGDFNRSLVADGRRTLRTHCVHGHEYTPENTRVRVDGHRTCRTCQRSQETAAYEARLKRR